MEDTQALQIERMELISNTMIIKSLCSPRAFERMLRVRDSAVPNTGIRANDLAIGFELMAQPALHGILDRVIRFPELLGIAGDELLLRWWSMVQGDDGTILSTAIDDEGTEIARIAGGIDGLITSFRRAGVSWDSLAEVGKEANMLADDLLEISRDCRISVLSGVPDTSDAHRILQLTTLRHLRDYWIQGPESDIFRYCRGLVTRWEQISRPGDSMFDIQSHRDPMRQFPKIDAGDFEPGWLIGKLAAVTVSLQETDLWVEGLPDPGVLLRESADLDQAWEKGNAIFRAVEERYPDECEFGLEAPPTLPSPILPSLTAPDSQASAADSLASLLGRSALLIGSRDARSRLQIATIVLGLACNLQESRPIEIIRIFHCPESDGVSLAVLMPADGMLSDASQWWVFHHAYRVRGTDASSSRDLAMLDETAGNLGGSVRYRDLVAVPAQRLLDLCDTRQFQHLSEQVREQEKVASTIRGVFPELLSVLLLSKAGYHFIRTSVEISFDELGEREFDTVGVQLASHGGDCRIIEVKGGSASRRNLEQAVERFADVVRATSQNRALLADTLGWPEPIKSVSGVFVAMARSVDIPEALERLDVEIWDLDRFKEELRRAKLPESRINLLEESLEVWEIGDFDF